MNAVSEWSGGKLKCGGNYDQMFREGERGSETFVIIIQNTIQLFSEKSRRERKIVTIKAEAVGRMTEKTDGGGERREAAPPPPRSYSEFMRNLAAKYNTENTTE